MFVHKSLGGIYLCPRENDLSDAIWPYSSSNNPVVYYAVTLQANLHDQPKVCATVRAAIKPLQVMNWNPSIGYKNTKVLIPQQFDSWSPGSNDEQQDLHWQARDVQ